MTAETWPWRAHQSRATLSEVAWPRAQSSFCNSVADSRHHLAQVGGSAHDDELVELGFERRSDRPLDQRLAAHNGEELRRPGWRQRSSRLKRVPAPPPRITAATDIGRAA